VSAYEEARDAVMAKRELDEKLAKAREEQREVDRSALIDFMHMKSTLREGWTDEELTAALYAQPLTFEPLRIRIEEQQKDLEQAAKVVVEEALEHEATKAELATEGELIKALQAELAAEKLLHLETQRELDWHRHGAKK
jgi:hypothetical protein